MKFDFLNDIISNKPLLALIYILSSIIIAYIVDKIFIASLRLLVKRSDTEIDDKILDFIHKPIYYSILFFGINIAVSLLSIPSKVNFYLAGTMKSIIIVFWAIALFRSFMIFIEWSSKKSRTIPFIQPKTIPLFENIGKIVLFLFSIYFVMLSWNIDVTAWIASAGIISVVIGLAAKDTLGNLFAGIFIMADSPYKEGDYINLDTGERGSVRHIGTRSTRILTRDDIEITIPNSVIATSKIINESGGPHEKERIRITLDVAYGSDIEKVKDIMLKIALNSNEVCDSPKPRARFRKFGESGLNLQLLCWIEKPELRGRVIDDLSISIYNNFNQEDIEIPFPQRTVHLKKFE